MASPIEERQLIMDLVGSWRLDSAYFIAQRTGDRVDILGANPFGFFILEPSGRMITILTSDARTRAAAAGDTTELYKSMISYTGTCSIDGEKVVTRVDGAWDPGWVGTEQVRYFTLDGHILSLRTAPLRHPSFPDDEVVGYVNWRKEV
jgi:Lipocalin-like domain